MPTHATKASEKKEPPRASLRKMRSQYVVNGYDEVLYLSQATHAPGDVCGYAREGSNCFDQKRYLATIILATAAVEIILNKDSRMRGETGGWRTLNVKLLRDAAAKGLPVNCLVAEGESLKDAGIEFVELRNRLAHGNLAGIIGFEDNSAPDYCDEAREIALAQMKKADVFVLNWYNTAPDVQERRILGGRWPKDSIPHSMHVGGRPPISPRKKGRATRQSGSKEATPDGTARQEAL